MIRKIIDFLISPYIAIRDHIRFKRRVKEMKKRDPFIYK